MRSIERDVDVDCQGGRPPRLGPVVETGDEQEAGTNSGAVGLRVARRHPVTQSVRVTTIAGRLAYVKAPPSRR